MKYKSFASIYLLISYLGYMFYRTPQIADSIIILALSGIFVYELFLLHKKESSIVVENAEIKKLKEELEVEHIKNSIENLKIQKNLLSLKRDREVASLEGADNGRRYSF